jgi:hypothetical protein
MGCEGSIRLAPHGNPTPITPSIIYFLDNRFPPLATSQKVCGAWREQSEARDRLPSVRPSSRPASRRASDKRTWRRSSGATNPSLRGLKVASAGSTSSNWSSLPAPLALTHSRFWRSLKLPWSLTIGFEPVLASSAKHLTPLGVSAGAARTNTQPISTKPSMPLQHGPKEAEAAIRTAQL